MSDVDLICVNPALIGEVWPVTREMVRAAIERGGLRTAFEGVERDVLSGANLLWLAWDGHVILACAVTRLDLIEGDKIGTIVACGGADFKRFGHLRSRLEQHFRDEGCAVSRIAGRKGWLKHYPDYRVKSLVLEKVL